VGVARVMSLGVTVMSLAGEVNPTDSQSVDR
jgi:hypothetical protein